MAFKVTIIFAFFGLVAAVPVIHHVIEGHHEEHEHHAPAEYKFSYSVHDEHTGDIKSQEEERHGDKVRGSYSLVEPDGHKRTVHYTADKHSGFHAEVHREGTSHHIPESHHEAPAVHHIQPIHVATHHVAHAAPIAIHHEAPSHGHVATSHANVQITHHEDHHGGYHH